MRIEKTNQRVHNRFHSKNIYAEQRMGFHGRAAREETQSARKKSKIINRNQEKLISFVAFFFHSEQRQRNPNGDGRKMNRRISNKHTRIPRATSQSRFESFKLFDALHIHFNG
jgi:hypothetical protein